VRAENLNPDVLVMQPANQGVRYDASDLLNRAKGRVVSIPSAVHDPFRSSAGPRSRAANERLP
jgi:hypothetical protein